MKAYFISWEIRPKEGGVAYSNTVTDAEDIPPREVFEKALGEICAHYETESEKVTARAFNEI